MRLIRALVLRFPRFFSPRVVHDVLVEQIIARCQRLYLTCYRAKEADLQVNTDTGSIRVLIREEIDTAEIQKFVAENQGENRRLLVFLTKQNPVFARPTDYKEVSVKALAHPQLIAEYICEEVRWVHPAPRHRR